MRYRILPYRQGSKGAKALADALVGKVLKVQGSAFNPQPSDVLINWGAKMGPCSTWIFRNRPGIVTNASNKLNFFRLMRDAGHAALIPPFWDNKDDIPDAAFPIVCRQSLAGHSGDGIVFSSNRDSLVPAPLYVGYIKKKDEYRVHVGKRPAPNSIDVVSGYEYVTIAVQRKARRLDIPPSEVNWQVRNHSNGFIFKRDGVNPPSSVIEAARIALECSGLDFGAVDVIWNEQSNKPYVLEINTAPGLEGQTIQDYANFFKGS